MDLGTLGSGAGLLLGGGAIGAAATLWRGRRTDRLEREKMGFTQRKELRAQVGPLVGRTNEALMAATANYLVVVATGEKRMYDEDKYTELATYTDEWRMYDRAVCEALEQSLSKMRLRLYGVLHPSVDTERPEPITKPSQATQLAEVGTDAAIVLTEWVKTNLAEPVKNEKKKRLGTRKP